MSAIYKTARGKSVDMDKIKLANESTTAVGNMRVNARGDALGAGGQVVAGRNQIMDQVYAVESNSGYSPTSPTTYAENKATMEQSKAKELHDLANGLVQTDASEPVVATEEAGAVTPAPRGSLASSVAKATTVTQEPMTPPSKSTGPTRI
ncbi:hypothetical protein UFOVP112_412 [uncultured Caudovirales phage]|uniref:Uncharacterized protein n=1 Tax=uncultured Caudovirales phage TaxID=2100421 RepID=A0A6J5L4F3_9CAUD|nr:hypothetical protein UFOVP112_412 [uncultured Caudovirales phage]